MIKRYKLNDKKEVVECSLEEGNKFLESDGRFIARDILEHEGEEYIVSTVFLSIDHNFIDNGPPLLFETMIFGPGADGVGGKRYHTYQEAMDGHQVSIDVAKTIIHMSKIDLE